MGSAKEDAEKLRTTVEMVIAHLEDGCTVSACEVLTCLAQDADSLAERLEAEREAGNE